MKRLGITLALTLCVSTLGGCKILEQLKKSGEAATRGLGSAEPKGVTPSSQDEKDGQLSDKLDGYIYCMNYDTRSVFRIKADYLDDVDIEKGPTGKETRISVQEISADTCLKGIDESKAKPPALPDLDAAAEAYKVALAELQKLTKTAHAYYDQKDFKDDQYAKGKAMHKPLVAAFEAFEKADTSFEDKVRVINDGISQRRLARLKNDQTRQLEYNVAKSVDDAKKLVKFAEVESLDKVDATGLAGALAAYEQTNSAMGTYIDGHQAEAGKVSLLSSFRSSCDDFLKAAKEFMRRKRDNKGFKGEHGSPEHIDGHPAQVLAKFNSMINDSNRLRFE
jgi:hypothetical protein